MQPVHLYGPSCTNWPSRRAVPYRARSRTLVGYNSQEFGRSTEREQLLEKAGVQTTPVRVEIGS